MIEHAKTYLKGAAMGAADIVPGVSGGTIAFIVGIYTRLVDGIAYVAESLKPRNLKDIWDRAKGFDYALFVPLLLGIATSILLLSNLLHYLLEHYVSLTYAFFFGLIAASVVFLFRQMEKFSPADVVSTFIGVLAGFILVGVAQVHTTGALWFLFVSGALAITAMILPGISGSMILLILSQYERVLGMIKDFAVQKIVVFGLGAITGLLLFSELLHYLLHKHRNVTFGFLTGLMIGSLRLPLAAVAEWGPPGQELLSLVLVIIGAGTVAVLEKMSK